MVSPEEELGSLCRPRRHARQELVLHDPVLVVAPFGPRVREQNEDRREPGVLRHRSQKILGVGADKVKVLKLGPPALEISPGNPFGCDVDSHAGLVRMGCGICSQEVAVAASDLPDKAVGAPDYPREGVAQGFTPRRNDRGVLVQVVGPQAVDSPSLLASIATMSKLMSVGFTPLMRLAWPSVSGFI